MIGDNLKEQGDTDAFGNGIVEKLVVKAEDGTNAVVVTGGKYDRERS